MSELDIRLRHDVDRIATKARIRGKTILAAIYEDCLQAFLQLASATKENLTWKPWNSEVNDSYSKLLAWGYETRASSQKLDLSLDYCLKKSTKLRTKTVELLGDLHSTLCEG